MFKVRVPFVAKVVQIPVLWRTEYFTFEELGVGDEFYNGRGIDYSARMKKTGVDCYEIIDGEDKGFMGKVQARKDWLVQKVIRGG